MRKGVVPRSAARRLTGYAFLLACGAVVLSGCAGSRTSAERIAVPQAVVKSSVRFQKEYVLAAGDQIEVAVWRVPEASRTLIIRPDGFITLPIVNDVQAAGLTARELSERLTTQFATRLVRPQVSVIAMQVRQPVVYVAGDVTTPMTVPLRTAGTAMQAISAAGGVRRSGSEGDVTVIRLAESGFLEAIPVESGADGQPGPYMGLAAMQLQPDDIVFVPEHGRSQVVRFLDDIVLKPLQLILNYKLIQQLNSP